MSTVIMGVFALLSCDAMASNSGSKRRAGEEAGDPEAKRARKEGEFTGAIDVAPNDTDMSGIWSMFEIYNGREEAPTVEAESLSRYSDAIEEKKGRAHRARDHNTQYPILTALPPEGTAVIEKLRVQLAMCRF
jgi:hypothetical protein